MQTILEVVVLTVIRGFKAIRPIKELVHKVSCFPYDELNFKGAYKKSKTILYSMISNGILAQDEKQCMYIYRLMTNELSQIGLVCCVSVNDYIHNNIIKHEYTMSSKEQDILNYIEYCEVNINPVLLTYKEDMHISSIIKEWMFFARGNSSLLQIFFLTP